MQGKMQLENPLYPAYFEVITSTVPQDFSSELVHGKGTQVIRNQPCII
jgi:hypothetical protein